MADDFDLFAPDPEPERVDMTPDVSEIDWEFSAQHRGSHLSLAAKRRKGGPSEWEKALDSRIDGQ